MEEPAERTPDPAPTFSILTAAYQAESTIPRMVRSVLAQTRSDWELVVVNDGSTDATAARASEAAAGDPRVTVITQDNTGPGEARNRGASRATGSILCILDADDEYHPDYLERMSALIESEPHAALYSCNADCVNPSGTRTRWFAGRSMSKPHSFTLMQIIEHNDVFIMTCIRAEAFHEVGGFDKSLSLCEDYDLWLRLIASGRRHAYTPELLGTYYRSHGSASANRGREAGALVHIFESMVAGGRLTSAEERAARRRIRSSTARFELERRRMERDFRVSRRKAFVMANAFGAPWRRCVARLMVVISPSWFVRVFARRCEAQLGAVYGRTLPTAAPPDGAAGTPRSVDDAS